MNDPKRVLIVALGIPLLVLLGFGIKGLIDSGGESNARMYNTAIQATETDRFNYTIDSHQGKLLGYGTFTATQLVKFPEMSKQFAYVQKSKEEYTLHTEEVCEEDSDGNETCHTETYYEWDFAGADELSTPTYKLHTRTYPASLFNLDDYKQRGETCEFTPPNTANWLQAKNGCEGRYYYTDNDTRFYYRVIESKFDAGFIADASNGTLSPLSGGTISLHSKSPEQMVKDANDFHTAGNVFIVMWFIFLSVGAAFLAYTWAMADGSWKNNE